MIFKRHSAIQDQVTDVSFNDGYHNISDIYLILDSPFRPVILNFSDTLESPEEF